MASFVLFAFTFLLSGVARAQVTNELSADDVVKIAVERNGEIEALRKEADSARAMVRQAGLRSNPTVEAKRATDVKGMDSQLMIEGALPLELGGRRAARIRVAEAEVAIRDRNVANAERLLAAEVRMKFGEALMLSRKLAVLDSILANAKQGYDLVAEKVADGKTAPLEQNMLLVEVNRLRSLREISAGKSENAMFELRNLLGMKPDEPLRLANDFGDLLSALPSIEEATTAAIATRPDLLGARDLGVLADAKIANAKAGARVDASVKTGYQRMRNSFPLNGTDDAGMPAPIENTVNMFTFGVEFELPVRNRNQGEIEAAAFEKQASESRVAFGEITIRREVAAAYARYNRAVRAQSIFENGVRDQADANLKVVWQTYELGKNPLNVYIDQQRQFLDIENEFIDAVFETYTARIEILRASNRPELVKK